MNRTQTLFYNALTFGLAAEIVNPKFTHCENLGGPTSLNHAFALESYLKCLHEIELGTPVDCKQHDLAAVFSRLSEETRTSITKSFSQRIATRELTAITDHEKATLKTSNSTDLVAILEAYSKYFAQEEYLDCPKTRPWCFTFFAEIKQALTEAIIAREPELKAA